MRLDDLRACILKMRMAVLGTNGHTSGIFGSVLTKSGISRDVYVRVAKEILSLAPEWQGDLTWPADKLVTGDEIHQGMCEVCLTETTVTLIRPIGHLGVISRHPDGDWICRDCDPRVAGILDMFRLKKLVGVESA